jgi:predicted metalloprotease
VWRCAAFEPLNDDHAAAAAGAEICRLRLGLGSIGADCFDGINGNYRRHEQFAGAGDVLGAFAAGEQAMKETA